MRFFLSAVTLAALVGCPSETANPGDGTTPRDSGNPVATENVDVTAHAALDGTVIDPLPVGFYNADEEEDAKMTALATGQTGATVKLPLPVNGSLVNLRLGSNDVTSSDGYSIAGYAGREYVHPDAYVDVSTLGCAVQQNARIEEPPRCEPIVDVNRYLPYDLYACVSEQYWYDDGKSDFRGDYVGGKSGDNWLEVLNGQDVIDIDDIGLQAFLADGCTLQSVGSTLAVSCPDDGQWTIDATWGDTSFTIATSMYDASVNVLTCTLQ